MMMFCDLWNCWWNCLCWWWRIVVNNRVLKTRVTNDKTCAVVITSIYTIKTIVFVSTAIVHLLLILRPYVLLFHLLYQQQNYSLRCGYMYYLHWCCQIHLYFVHVKDPNLIREDEHNFVYCVMFYFMYIE